MKKTLFLLLALTLAFSTLFAAAAPAENFILKGDGAAETIHIVYPKDCNDLIKEYAEVFAERLSELTGAEVTATDTSPSTFSYVIPEIFIGEEYDNSLYVAYLTAQNDGLLPFMPETEDEWGKYCGTTSMYSMHVKDSELHINASEEWALYCAIDDFLKEVEIAETVVLSDGMNILPGEDYIFPDPTEIIGQGKKPYFALTEKVAELPAIYEQVNIYDYSDSLQGGGTDGKYAYIGGDGPGDLGMIYKYSLPDWTLVDVSKPILIKHVNAISYIEEKNLLTAAHCTDGDVRGFAYIDPGTLEVVGYGETPIDCWGLEYDNEKERFLVEVNWTNYIFDKDFNLIKEMPYGDSDGTPQTLYVDGEYIYDVRYKVFWDTDHSKSTPDPELGQNYITVHDYENVYLEKAPVPNIVGEAEHMFRHGNLYYIGYIDNIVDGTRNHLGVIYECVLLPEVWWAN